jgi:KilA-N domain/Protein of unknown function (DUF3627)
MPAITFQSVDNQYEWGYYFDIKVLIMTQNGYINATKMCQDENKQFRFWLQNDSSKELLDEFERYVSRPSDLMIKNIVGPNEFRGTYVHLDLVPHIAYWVSVPFAIKVGKIVNEYLLKEEKIKHSLDTKEKDDTIDELKSLIKDLQKDTKSVLNSNRCMETQISDLTDNVSKLSLDNEITHEMLNVVIEDRVIKPKDKDSISSIVIYESIDQGPNIFYIFRVQKRSLKAAIKRYKADNPNAVKFYEIEYNPNSINYYQRFKQKYKNEIRKHYNRFELLDITKDQLKDFIEEINNEKYQIENFK